MSNYDPFRLYTHRQKSTNKGQVLRKKIPTYNGRCYTDEELKRAIEALEGRGYTIFKPNQPYFRTKTVFFSNVYTIPSGQLTFQNLNDTMSISFGALWEVIYSQFAPYLNVDPITTSNVLFSVDLLSINLFSNFNLPNANGSVTELLFYFFDPNQTLDIDSTYQRSFKSEFSGTYSLQAFDNTRTIATIISTSYSNFRESGTFLLAKKENINNPYLYNITRQQPAILRALKEKDYTAFNPNLFSVVFTGQAPGPLTIASSSYSVRVHLQYDI